MARKSGRIIHAHRGGAVRRTQVATYAAPWSGSLHEPKRWIGEVAYDRQSDVPEDLLNRGIMEKYPWINRFVKEGCPYGMLMPYARLYAEAAGIPEEDIPPYTTLNTWVHRFKAYGLPGLMDGVRSHAGQSYALGLEGYALLKAAVVGGKQTPTAAHAFVNRHLERSDWGRERRRKLSRAERRALVSYNTIRRGIKRLRIEEPHLFSIATNGELYYRNVYRLALSQGMLPAGFRYSIDSTVADIWVRIPDPQNAGKWIAVRVALTVIMDVGSRLLLTFGLSLFKLDSGVILGILQRAVDPRANYVGLPSLGVPTQVSLDRGPEHRRHVEACFQHLLIEVVPGMPNDPQGHAQMERLIQTITTEVLSHQRGYSPTHGRFDPYAPAEQDAKRSLTQLKYEGYRLELPVESLLTLPELEAKILAWATVYNERPHPSLPVNSPEFRRMLELANKHPDASLESAA